MTGIPLRRTAPQLECFSIADKSGIMAPSRPPTFRVMGLIGGDLSGEELLQLLLVTDSTGEGTITSLLRLLSLEDFHCQCRVDMSGTKTIEAGHYFSRRLVLLSENRIVPPTQHATNWSPMEPGC